MATVLIVETYQVCAGVSAADPNPTLLGPDFRTREAAERHLELMLAAAASGAITVAAVLFVRPTPGAQTIPVSEPATLQSLRSDLADRQAQVVVFARVQVDGNPAQIRVGSLPARAVAALQA